MGQFYEEIKVTLIRSSPLATLPNTLTRVTPYLRTQVSISSRARAIDSLEGFDSGMSRGYSASEQEVETSRKRAAWFTQARRSRKTETYCRQLVIREPSPYSEQWNSRAAHSGNRTRPHPDDIADNGAGLAVRTIRFARSAFQLQPQWRTRMPLSAITGGIRVSFLTQRIIITLTTNYNYYYTQPAAGGRAAVAARVARARPHHPPAAAGALDRVLVQC